MGCCNGKNWKDDDDWEQKMIVQEYKVLELSGVKMSDVHREFTMIEMDGAPFKVRTFYIGKEDKEKPTLLLIHGNMACFIGFFMLIKNLSEKYRVVGIDNMNLGLSTRSTSKAPHKDPETAEAWIQEYYTKTLDALDLPEKFYLVGHSWGGWGSMMIASIKPERLEGLFLMSPAGVEGYDPATYETRCKTFLTQNGGKEEGLVFKKSENKFYIETYAAKQHPFKMVHDLPGCLQNMLYNAYVAGTEKMVEGGVSNALWKPLWKEWAIYYKMMLMRTGEGDITMTVPFMHACISIHHMTSTDRMNQAAINFPVAMAFGDQDFFASNVGGEDILKACQANGSRVNLFKMEGGHCFYAQDYKATSDAIIGHFEGTIVDKWEPTIYGDYQWRGKKPSKGWAFPLEKQKQRD